jgi:glycosyltransferase involved in cell wall biosynthesis
MIDQPHVSILMPVYNGELFVREAVESILTQTFQVFELIVIDDGSIDNSAAILAKYQQADDRVRLYRQPKNQGLVTTLNHGLQLVRGDFLARMDADDLSLPERLAQQVDALDADPALVIVGSAYELIGVKGEFLRIDRYPAHDTSIRWQMLFHNSFAHSSVMVRMTALRRNDLGYNTQLVHAEDYDLWSRLLGYGKGANFEIPLIKHRQHSAQLTQAYPTMVRDAGDQICQQNLNKLNVTLSLDEVKTLRDWYYRFPSRIDQTNLKLCQSLIQILLAYCSEPGLDAKIISHIRSRYILHMLKATPIHLWNDLWAAGLPQLARPNDILTMLRLVFGHLLRTSKG